jgi:hypothetical protein
MVAAISFFSGGPQGMPRYILGAPAVFVMLNRLGNSNEAFDRSWTIGSVPLMGLLALLFAVNFREGEKQDRTGSARKYIESCGYPWRRSIRPSGQADSADVRVFTCRETGKVWRFYPGFIKISGFDPTIVVDNGIQDHLPPSAPPIFGRRICGRMGIIRRPFVVNRIGFW